MIFTCWPRIRIWTVLCCLCFATRAATNELAFGEVRVDPVARAISFPAQVNQRAGDIEYFLVHETGKVHESVFRTKVTAQQIHAAALLFSETSTNQKPRLLIKNIEASWTDGAAQKRFTAAELIFDKEHRHPLKETKWAYRGSRLIDGIFLAQRDGSLIAIMEDRDALIDQDTPAAADDKNWEPVSALIPSIGQAVTITVYFNKP